MRGPLAVVLLSVLALGGCSLAPLQSDRRAPVEDRSAGGAPRPAPRASVPSEPLPPAVVAPVPPPEPLEPVPVSPPPPPTPPPPTPVPAPPAAPPPAPAPGPAAGPSPGPPPAAPAPTTLALGPPAPTSHPAVSTLLGQARQQARDGQLEQASASLERALRIEPSNPWVWHQLALVRLFQNQEEQAAQMATRSNTFARDRDLQARNWRVIAQARERQGDLEGAGEAAGHAQRLGGG